MLGLIEPIVNAFEGLVSFTASRLKVHAYDACRLETTRNEHTFVANNGDLLTYVRVDGVLDVIGPEGLADQLQRLRLVVDTILHEGRHEIHWVFDRSKTRARVVLDAAYHASKLTAERCRLDVDFISSLINERQQLMLRHVCAESSYLVFVSRLAGLPPHDLKAGLKATATLNGKSGIADLIRPPYNQALHIGAELLTVQHEAALRQLVQELRQPPLCLVVEPLEVHDAVRAVAQMLYREGVSDHWRPRLPGDPVSARSEPLDHVGAVDNFALPSLAQQIFRHQPTIDDTANELVYCAGRWHGTAAVSLGPVTTFPWDSLFRAIPGHIEWRYSISLTGGHKFLWSRGEGKKNAARLLRATTRSNDQFMGAWDALHAIVERDGAALCTTRIAVTVSAETRAAALSHVAEVHRALQGWGGCDACIEQGDAAHAMISTLPGMDNGDLRGSLLGPVHQAVHFLPTTRPASPWREGGVVFRTPDGKLYPYQSGSREQQSWIELIVGASGGGKSVHLNTLNFATLLTPGLSELPKLAILDIGPSSKGLVDLVRDLLPPRERDLAVASKLKNEKRFANNPFETLLGLDYPTSSEKGFLVNFLTLLFTPASATGTWEMLPELCATLIDETYRYFAESRPKVYQPGVEPRIDKHVADNPGWVGSNGELLWRDIVRQLMNAGNFIDAGRAHRHAVPLLKQLSGILKGSKIIRDTFGAYVPPSSNTPLIDMAQMMIQTAVSDYPILAHPTAFNPSVARIVALDLAEVATGSGPQGIKNTALMYMLGRHMLVRDIFLDEDDAARFPEPSRSYYLAHVRKMKSIPKRICFDELHRTGGVAPVRRQLEQDGREGRKLGIQLALASQMHTDFDQALVDLASNFWILLAPHQQIRDDLAALLGLSPAAQEALKNDVRGAGPQGASFLLWSRTKGGTVTQPLVSSLGPQELWTHSTTAEDSYVRQVVFEAIGRKAGTARLAERYPSGTVSSVVEAALAKTPDRSRESVLDDIVKQIVGTSTAP